MPDAHSPAVAWYTGRMPRVAVEKRPPRLSPKIQGGRHVGKREGRSFVGSVQVNARLSAERRRE